MCFVSITLGVTCVSCKAHDIYKIADYINDLAVYSGMSDVDDLDDNFSKLLSWGVLIKEDENVLNDELNYGFLARTIISLIDFDQNGLQAIKELGWIKLDIKENDYVEKKTAEEIIEKAIQYLNNRDFVCRYDVNYKENVKQKENAININDVFYDEECDTYKKIVDINEGEITTENANYDDVFNSVDIEDSFEIDLNNSTIIPFNEIETNYTNTSFNLLANKSHSFESEGFRVSYSVNASNLSIHISKKLNDLNCYGDISISNIRPSFKYKNKNNDDNNLFFKVSFNSSEKLGASIGKYENYYLNFKDLDSKSFINKLKRSVNKQDDELEAIIPICVIKTPIPEIPTASINLEVIAKVYVSGKVEVQFYNNHELGFETKNGVFRIINNSSKDYDAIASGSCKELLGLNFGLEAVNTTLADVELDGGIKAEIKTTAHLFDDDGNISSEELDIPYSIANDIAYLNNDVGICGDVSFRWVFDIVFNTYRSKLYKLGFTKTINIMDDDNQVFGNLHHIENFKFVEKCTRKSKKPTLMHVDIVHNKITLKSYAKVLTKNGTYQIEVSALPQGYNINDLLYSSENNKIATVNKGKIQAISPGSTKIKVHTADGKYDAYVNVLVSSE